MAVALTTGVVAGVEHVEPPTDSERPSVYHPRLVVSPSLEPFVDDITPGNDLFPDERDAGEVIGLLSQLSDRLKGGGDRAQAAVALLSPSFRGGRIAPLRGRAITTAGPLRIERFDGAAGAPAALGARALGRDFERLLGDIDRIAVAQFDLTSFDLGPGRDVADSRVRFEFVGAGTGACRAQLTGYWTLRWRREAAGWRVVAWTANEWVRSVASTPVFRDVTQAAFGGIESFRRQLAIGFDAWAATVDSALARDSQGHHGLAVADVDGDGLDDVYVAQPYGFPDRLYRARGDGTFEDWTARAGLGTLDDTQQALFGDLDNDGDQDLLLTGGAGPLLFVNDGSARFTARPGAFRMDRPIQGAPMSMAMADFDRDGYLDVYLCVYSYYYGAGEAKAGTPTPYHDAVNGPPNVLFRNDGRGGFADVTSVTGLDVNNDRYSFAAAWGDYDGDGWPDLFVANDFGRKNLYRNRGLHDGRVTFEDVTAQAGVEDHAAGMSTFWLDYDADGRLDIYAGQMWSANGLRVTASRHFMPEASDNVRALYRRHARGNSLLRNRGDGTFEDVSLAAGVNMGRWSWSTGKLDFDSDGWVDLYMVTGMVTRDSSPEDLDWMFWGGVVARSPLSQATGTPYDDAWRAINRFMVKRSVAGHQRNIVLRNDGRGTFDDVSGAVGLDLDEDGRSFAVTDVDRDGDPDVISLAPRSAPQLRLFRNDYAPRGAVIAVRLVGSGSSNRDAVGAKVTVETDVMRRTDFVHAGSGFLSQHSKELLLGLGQSRRLVRLTIEWPDGQTQVISDVTLNQRLRIHQSGEVDAEPLSVAPAPPPPDRLSSERPSPPSATWLYEPLPVPAFTLPDLTGASRSLSALRGKPAVVLAWASDVPASRDALRELNRRVQALSAAGVSAIALAFDRQADMAKVRVAAAGISSVPVVVASEDVARAWAILHRHLFIGQPDLQLPTTFLLDADERVVRVYRGAVDVDEIRRDADAIDASPDERLARARPFEGSSSSIPGRRDLVPYGRDLLDQGLDALAVAVLELAAQGSPNASVLYRLASLLAKQGNTSQASDAYARALALQPDLPEAHNDLGTLLAQAGNLPEAIARFRAALALTPEYPDALNNLGYALLLTGDEAGARQYYEKALALQPDFPEALNNLGLIEGRGGDLVAAEAHFREALGARPSYAEAASNLAVALVSRGDADEATRLLAAFIDAHPQSDAVYVTLAKIHLSLGRTADGLAVLDRLLVQRPDHPVARELRQRYR